MTLLKKGFKDKENKNMEFHIDNSDLFTKLLKDLLLYGMISIRKNPVIKIRIVVGQDELIFLPHSLKKFFWTVEGHIILRTKTEGI